jgi:glycosyltransferase involved in cell wall biosynthesis
MPFRLIGPIAPEQREAARALSNVEALGMVSREEYRAFLTSVSIALMPFPDACRGGGSRLKLLEGALAGLALAGTPTAYEGFDAPHLGAVAATDRGLAEALERLAADPATRARAGLAARDYVMQAHDQTRLAHQLSEAYDEILSAIG